MAEKKEQKKKEGRPAKWDSPEALDKQVDAYFESINSKEPKEPPTITGLCLFLGFESRQSFHDYKDKPEFSYTIKRARLKIEHEYEKSLYRQSPTGPIFALKNLGWSDKQEVDHTSGGKPITDTKHEVIFKDYSK